MYVSFKGLDNNIFLCISESAAEAVAVNPYDIKILSVNGVSIFFSNCNQNFDNDRRSLQKKFS